MPALPAPPVLSNRPASAAAALPALLGDVAGLMDASRPRPSVRHAGRALLAVWAVALVGPLLGMNAPVVESVAVLATLAASIFLAVLGSALRQETATLDRIEAMLALRRTGEAAPQLHALMARPMRAAENRLRAMLLLGGVLARLDRHDDALTVYDELIDAEGLAGPGGAAVKLARAGEMLRADHLYDADRAINDLRRLIDRGGAAAELHSADANAVTAGTPADGIDVPALAALRLLELHRDVKTGHLAEAVELFDANGDLLRSGLGHRVADAHALAAVALHRLNRPADAAARYADATALAPLSELVRRYPDLWPLTQVYPATIPPR